MSQLTEDSSSIRQAIMCIDVHRSELRIVASVAGKPVFGTGCAFHTLLGANAAFHDIARSTLLTDPRLAGYIKLETATADISCLARELPPLGVHHQSLDEMPPLNHDNLGLLSNFRIAIPCKPQQSIIMGNVCSYF